MRDIIPGMVEPAELTTLRALAARVARAHGVATYEAMWQLGFELLDKLESFGYHCTPMNSFDVAGRLDELDRRHTEHLRLPDFEEWKRRHGV